MRGQLVRLSSDTDNADASTFPVARRTDSSGTVRIGYSFTGTGSGRDLATGRSQQGPPARTAARYDLGVIQTFRHRGLRQGYETGDFSRVEPQLAKRIAVALADLDSASKPSDLDMGGYRLHPLKGDMRGLWSIAVASSWRIVFRFEDGDAHDVDLIDYH